MDNKKTERKRSSAAEVFSLRMSRSHDYRLIKVFVEGYDDVAFWRSIFDDFETRDIKFEITVPTGENLAKGKNEVLKMIPFSNEDMILCVDSDFDYLFGGATPHSKIINNTKFLFHTYTYATENYVCWAPTLHNVCVKATKNDTLIFDFVEFLESYSRIIYPLFLWYSYSARCETQHAFSLIDFKNTVKLNYLDLKDNGINTLEWLSNNVQQRLESLRSNFPSWRESVARFGREIEILGVTPSNTYLFMQGHTLMDNVVLIILKTVCDRLKEMATERIMQGSKKGIALQNELNNYNNSLRNVKDVLLDNEAYKDCPLCLKLSTDIQEYIEGL